MKKTLLSIALTVLAAAPTFAQDAEPFTLTVGNFDNPGQAEISEGAGSWWEKAPFQWYTKYSGSQMIYDAEYLTQLADDNGSITEVVFKYGDEGAFLPVEADLTIYVENTDAAEFEKKPETEQYMWVNFDPSSSTSAQSYSVDLYYMEDEEIHFVLDKPLKYTGGNLLITAWSEVTNDSEIMTLVYYAMRTGKYTTMCMGSDRESFEQIYDTGLQYPYQSPLKNVPVLKLLYTKGAGIADVEADTNAPVQYFNLQGVAVQGDTLAPGIYIRRQGTTATKVTVN